MAIFVVVWPRLVFNGNIRVYQTYLHNYNTQTKTRKIDSAPYYCTVVESRFLNLQLNASSFRTRNRLQIALDS